ncbi:hypothetical protein HMPREF9538_01990, partial [Klebsiella sp. MS 92-3]
MRKLLPAWVKSAAVQCAQSWRAGTTHPPASPTAAGWRTSPAR